MAATEETLVYRGRDLPLARLDVSRRAWDAADRHVLGHLEEHPPEGGPILIIGDSCGALTVALHAHHPWHLSDSVLAQRTTRRNLVQASLDPDAVAHFLPATVGCPTHEESAPEQNAESELSREDSAPTHPTEGSTVTEPARSAPRVAPGSPPHQSPFGLVLLRVPRSMALLRFYLNTIQSMIGPQSRIIAFGMTRHLSPRLREMFAKELGPVRVSPVRQKSVLFHIQPEIFEVDARALAPDRYLLSPELLPAAPDQELEIWSYPGVFSQKRLDLGTRLLLGNLPAVPPGATVVDLGCGAGVLGLAIALRSPDARLILVDDSFLAVRSAQETFARNGLKAEFYADDGLSGFEPGSVDVIVSNPPIHDGGAYEVEESVRLIRQARAALRKPGSIRLVSVHGADLRPQLQALFPKVSPVASTRRFAVWAASS